MTAGVRRALIWGGIFLLAFASGSVLGRFTVSGLAGKDGSLPNSSDVQNFWAAQDRGRAEGGEGPIAPSISYAPQPHGNHVCDGCDAGEMRGRLRIESLGGTYAPDEGENSEPGGSEEAPALAKAPPPPATPSAAGH